MTENRKVVCLGMPASNGMTGHAARGFYRSTRGRLAVNARQVQPEELARVDLRYQESSLLALNFNILWCWALNQAHKGGGCDYFAMLHADVEPEEFWLDLMVEELERVGVDVLAAVVPIKDGNGTTTTALGRPDRRGTGRPYARVTMHEVYRLPATFTAAAAGHPDKCLLINTGCWVCRFDLEWCKKLHFTVNDRIAFDRKADQFVAECESEDWFFSRLLEDLGRSVAATRIVSLGHRGPAVFTNSRPWGRRQFDAEYVSATIVPASAEPAFKFPHDVEGWLAVPEGEALADLAAGKRVVEIGSYCGKSTVCLAQTAESVASIDPHDGRDTPTPGGTLERFRDNLERFGVADRVAIHVGTADQVAPTLPARSFDVAFIDGAHDERSVQSDILHALRLLRPGGLLAFHDYRKYPGEFDERWDPGVTAAVDELLASGATLERRFRSVAIVRPANLTAA